MESNKNNDENDIQAIIHTPPTMPGQLQGSCTIRIHTTHGWRMVYSRRSDGTSSPMTGLFRFASRMNDLWRASSKNDPFSDFYMDKIYYGIENAIDEIHAHQKMLDILFHKERQKGMQFDLATSNNPSDIPLDFSNPYGYKASKLITVCDEFIRTSFTCRHVGLISYEKNEKNTNWAMKKVLSTFDMQRDYKITDVTREDALAKNEKWYIAVKLMEDLPVEFISGRRAKVAPPLDRIDEQ